MEILERGIGTIVLGFLYWLTYELWLPTLSFAYIDGTAFFIIGVIMIIIIIQIWIRDDLEEILIAGAITSFIGAAAICLILFVGAVIIGGGLINSGKMYRQIGEIDYKSFKEDIVEIETSQIPIVDIDLADKLADKKLGEELALGSQVEVGQFTNKQQVNGKLIYVAPLNHRSF